VNIEAANAVHALKLLEAIEWDLGCAGYELEQLGALLLVEGSNSSPEPLDLLRRRSVVMVLRVALPVIEINIRQAGDEMLKLLLVEDGNELGWNDVVES